MTKSKAYHSEQYPAQRLRYFKNTVQGIKDNTDNEEDFNQAILMLKNDHIEDVELINKAVELIK